ncbi:MAG: hypothetical protein PHD46_07660 [Eubacteriales bacterium]|nr:hypothetical protein [Eubacteriales bacterium]
MESNATPTLKTDNTFKNLIRPLSKKEYLQLEENILSDGCLDPIIVWEGIIVDGHNRYEICKRHGISFQVYEMDFDSREAVIAWICAHQLGRRNITEETRKFLIGMQYESEKIVNSRRNEHGKNQFSASDSEDTTSDSPSADDEGYIPSGHRTAQRIAVENNVSYNTVQKYAIYTRALELLGKKAPDIVPKILSGRYKISHSNVVEMSRLSPEQIAKVCKRIEEMQQPFVQYKNTRSEIQDISISPSVESVPAPSVKTMPAFDPDAEVTGLTLTIPSWGSLIERTRTKTNITIVSKQAKQKLSRALSDLQNKITEMLSAIKED